MRKGFLIHEKMRKYLQYLYLRRPLVIYDRATAPVWISYRRKISFSFLSGVVRTVQCRLFYPLLVDLACILIHYTHTWQFINVKNSMYKLAVRLMGRSEQHSNPMYKYVQPAQQFNDSCRLAQNKIKCGRPHLHSNTESAEGLRKYIKVLTWSSVKLEPKMMEVFSMSSRFWEYQSFSY